MPEAVSIRSLRKDFPLPGSRNYVRAVDDLSFSVREKQVFGLLGPNGSGKSTTIKIMLGLIEPSAGACEIFGRSGGEPRARARVGYLPEAPFYYRQQTATELLRYYGALAGVERRVLGPRAASLLERFGIADAAERKLASYSKGMLQRFGFAQAMIGDPDLLVLDEPTAGVDPVGAAQIGVYIRELQAEGKTIVLCSHLLSQVQSVCDRVAILDRGKLIAEGSLDQLLVRGASPRLVIDGLGESDRAALAADARARGGQVAQAAPEMSLEELFLALVSAEGARSEADRP